MIYRVQEEDDDDDRKVVSYVNDVWPSPLGKGCFLLYYIF